jgi:hypothetical protein
MTANSIIQGHRAWSSCFNIAVITFHYDLSEFEYAAGASQRKPPAGGNCLCTDWAALVHVFRHPLARLAARWSSVLSGFGLRGRSPKQETSCADSAGMASIGQIGRPIRPGILTQLVMATLFVKAAKFTPCRRMLSTVASRRPISPKSA